MFYSEMVTFDLHVGFVPLEGMGHVFPIHPIIKCSGLPSCILCPEPLGYPLAYKQFTDVTTSALMAFTSTGKKWARNGEFIRRD